MWTFSSFFDEFVKKNKVINMMRYQRIGALSSYFLLLVGVVYCQSADGLASSLDQNLITNEISKEEIQQPVMPSKGNTPNSSNDSDNMAGDEISGKHLNETDLGAPGAMETEDPDEISNGVNEGPQNNTDTQGKQLENEIDKDPITQIREDHMSNNDSQKVMDVEKNMDNVMEELQKAIDEVQGSKEGIEKNLEGSFRQPITKLKDTASLLETQLPLFENTLQKTLAHESHLQSFLKQSARSNRRIVANLANGFTKLNTGMIADLLRQQVTMYVQTIMPALKMLEVEYLVNLVQQELDYAQRDYEKGQQEYYNQQQSIVAELSQKELTKQDILNALGKISEDLKIRQRDQHNQLPTVYRSVREKVDISVSQIRDNMKKLLSKLKNDQQGLTKAMDVQKGTLEAVIAAGVGEMKKIYTRRAILNMDQLADQEIKQFEDYRAATGELKASWNDLDEQAHSVDMHIPYDQHESIALKVEDSRTAIRHLPNLIRGVKIRTITQVLAYLTLSLLVFGAVSLSVTGVLLAARLVQTFVAQNKLWKKPHLTSSQQVDFWHQRRRSNMQ